jgi:mannose-6-phosphate isomerase-like protein (cupin superfamily)
MKLIRENSKADEDRGGYNRKVLLEHVFKQKDAINSVWAALVTIPPLGVANTHFHENVTEIFYFLGSGALGVNDKEYNVNSGDLVIVAPQEAHWVKAGETPLKIVVFKLPNIPEDKTLVE